jgi:hypothetical protein
MRLRGINSLRPFSGELGKIFVKFGLAGLAAGGDAAPTLPSA